MVKKKLEANDHYIVSGTLTHSQHVMLYLKLCFKEGSFSFKGTVLSCDIQSCVIKRGVLKGLS